MSEWDTVNVESMTEQEKQEWQQEQWRRQRAQAEADRLRRREARGYFNIPEIPEEIVRHEFPHHTNATREEGYSSWWPWGWTAGRVVYFCHHCGAFGYKYNDISELFKCYCCRSRNVTVCRSGEISMLMRRHSGVGIHMQDVYDRRQERIRERRRQRRNRE
jgi:hypothetical protein